ncbi:hypothetical protein PoB_004516700 [Plakobranchus ocellatus]|uniref:Uncharacterized protein n=1 Tax=Plakobranchus ocellatus TaxID=259542 RepID=A0AAV4BI88_9GAST|nr:hypothetical protein PoB_004516700 [Plakobranchus ocellatus]
MPVTISTQERHVCRHGLSLDSPSSIPIALRFLSDLSIGKQNSVAVFPKSPTGTIKRAEMACGFSRSVSLVISTFAPTILTALVALGLSTAPYNL